MLSKTALLALAPLAAAQLNELAQNVAGKLYFGTATDNGEISNSTYYNILTNTSEFGQITPANGMKWYAVEPEQGVFDFSQGEVVSNITSTTGQTLRCHNLVWHSQLAPWVESQTWDRDNLTAMLKNHVYNEAKHWAGQCYAWDVVNEGLNEDGTYRNDTFFNILGESYFLIAFEQAALADPAAKLYYNDYNIESPGPKAEAVKRIIKYIKGAGLRIDGVGLQSHFVVGSTPSIDDQISTMQGYIDLGVEVAQTELDIRLELPTNDTNLAQQKEDYKNSVGACVQTEGCVGITVWDFYDPFSWVPSVFTGFGAADLWFPDFTKHPAYEGVVEALTNVTGGSGKCKRSGKANKSRRAQLSRPLF